MSHDTDKLIRQLSLVAFLMAERRPLTARDVKQNVEGYQEMSDEAFARRFYSDRAELLALGVPLDSQRDEFTGEELYRLSSERYFLPPLELTDEELAALQTCLYLLEGQFAYAEPLRLALQNLALGRPGFEEAPTETARSVELHDPGYSPELPGRLAKLEGAISKSRTLKFEYWSIVARRAAGADRQPVRAALRPGPVVRRRPRPRRREDQDLPRLADPRRHPPRDAPRARLPAARGLRRRRVPAAAAVAGRRTIEGEARIEVGGDTAWWVDRLYGRYGKIEDGVFVTDYSDLGQLSSWILRQDGRAVPLAPPELRRLVRADLELVHKRHEGAPAEDRRRIGGRRSPRPRSGPASPVPPERFGLLQALLAYLLDRCGDDTQAVHPGRRTSSSASTSPRSRSRSTCSCSTSSTSAAAATPSTRSSRTAAVHVEKELFGDTFRSPPRLTPLEARAIRLALEFVGPMIAADAHTPLERVRRKLEETFGEFDLGQTAEPQVGPGRGEARRNAQRRHPPAAARRDRVPEGGRGDALDAARRAVRHRAGAALLVRPHLGSHPRRPALLPARPYAQREAPARGLRASRGVPARPAEQRRRRRAHLVLARRSGAGRSRRERSRCPTAQRSPRRRSAARSGSSARSSATAARRCCSSRRTSGSRSPGGRSRWHAS